MSGNVARETQRQRHREVDRQRRIYKQTDKQIHGHEIERKTKTDIMQEKQTETKAELKLNDESMLRRKTTLFLINTK